MPPLPTRYTWRTSKILVHVTLSQAYYGVASIFHPNLMKSRYTLVAFLLTASMLTACSSQPATPSPSQNNPAPAAQTPASTPAAPATPAETPSSTDATLPVKFTMSDDFKTVSITKGTKLAATVTVVNKPSTGPMVNTLKETSKSVYFNTCDTGFGGYILYAFCYGPTYRFDRTTDTVTKILSDGQVFDVSPNEDQIVWVENGSKSAHQFKIRTIATGKDQVITSPTVPAKYGQYGDAKFSPDAKKIAFAAAIGDSEKEQGSVIVADIATGKLTYVVQDKADAIYTIKGWKDVNTVDYVMQQ